MALGRPRRAPPRQTRSQRWRAGRKSPNSPTSPESKESSPRHSKRGMFAAAFSKHTTAVKSAFATGSVIVKAGIEVFGQGPAPAAQGTDATEKEPTEAEVTSALKNVALKAQAPRLYSPGRLLHLQREKGESGAGGSKRGAIIEGSSRFEFIALRSQCISDHMLPTCAVDLDTLLARLHSEVGGSAPVVPVSALL